MAEIVETLIVHECYQLKLSTKPIIAREQTTYNFRKTNWNSFREKANEQLQQQKTTNIVDPNEVRKTDVEKKLKIWYTAIENTCKETIPKKRYSYYPFYIDNDIIRQSKEQFKNVRLGPFYTSPSPTAPSPSVMSH